MGETKEIKTIEELFEAYANGIIDQDEFDDLLDQIAESQK